MRLYEVLKAIREENGLTQSDVAKILNMHPASYANYEIGKRTPDYNVLIKLADHYNISLDNLLGRKDYYHTEIKQEKKPLFKSDLHEEIITIINLLDKEDLLMLKGYLIKLLEKYELSKRKEDIG